MNCILLTLTFPYGNGDPFLKDEIDYLGKCFETVYVLPLIRGENRVVKLPLNVKVLIAKRSSVSTIFRTLSNITRIIREVRFAYSSGYSGLKKILHRAIMYEYRYQSVRRMLQRIDDRGSIFYAYWLSEPAYVLSRYKENHPYAKAVSRAHGYDCFKGRRYNPYRREVAQGIDYIFSISEKGKADLEMNLLPLDIRRKLSIGVSHLGITIDKMKNPPMTSERIFRIVSCSNVVPIKRLDLLAEAISILNNNNKDIEWIHFGGGELFDDLRERVSKITNPDRKKVILRGTVDHQTVMDFYRSTHVDLFVNCSDAEGIPVSIMEAMGCGIPCIARNVGGISELITDQKDGFIVPEKTDAIALADAIEKIMIQGIPDSIRHEAQKKISDQFSAQYNYSRFAEELVGIQSSGEIIK